MIILVAEGGTAARVLIAILTEYQLYLAQAYMCHLVCCEALRWVYFLLMTRKLSLREHGHHTCEGQFIRSTVFGVHILALVCFLLGHDELIN